MISLKISNTFSLTNSICPQSRVTDLSCRIMSHCECMCIYVCVAVCISVCVLCLCVFVRMCAPCRDVEVFNPGWWLYSLLEINLAAPCELRTCLKCFPRVETPTVYKSLKYVSAKSSSVRCLLTLRVCHVLFCKRVPLPHLSPKWSNGVLLSVPCSCFAVLWRQLHLLHMKCGGTSEIRRHSHWSHRPDTHSLRIHMPPKHTHL